MGMELKYGLIKQNIQGSIFQGRRKARGNSFGVTMLLTKEILKTTTLKVKENMYGPMAENSRGSGSITRCMEMDYLHGPMENNMKVHHL